FAGFALTEPEGGTGADIRTTAVRQRGHYVINGQKHLISFADISNAFNITARTGDDKITAFLVSRDTPGLTIRAMPECMGMRGSFHGVLTFQDCRLPATEVLGEVGEGLDLHLDILDLSRGSIALSCVGLSQHFLELAVDYAKKRVTFSRPLAARQAIQGMLADMATQVHAGRLITRDIAQKFDQGQPIRKEASMAKLFGIETVRRVSDQALEILGGIGYTKTYPLERMYRDSRALWLEEGPPTIQRLVVARETLKD
ncbi:MAG: acyl-CoA dehydrogenase, partial [Chloroflexota bacterium]|nr:acyl-CoA dehydrogenase [Chloroflexota bacterium]